MLSLSYRAGSVRHDLPNILNELLLYIFTLFILFYFLKLKHTCLFFFIISYAIHTEYEFRILGISSKFKILKYQL